MFLDCSTEESKDYFYLYRISYLWYCPLGFLFSLITGWIASWITRWIYKEDLIEIDLSLLSPIVAKREEKRRKTNKFKNTITFNKY